MPSGSHSALACWVKGRVPFSSMFARPHHAFRVLTFESNGETANLAFPQALSGLVWPESPKSPRLAPTQSKGLKTGAIWLNTLNHPVILRYL
jgi:hypothetical protein